MFPGDISEAGIYTSALSAAQITQLYEAGLGVAGLPAQITVQPQPVDTFMGGAPTMSVTVNGTAPIAYQWQFSPDGVTYVNLTNNVGYTGVTNSALTIKNVTLANVGYYDVVVTNLYGSLDQQQCVPDHSPAGPGGSMAQRRRPTNLTDESGYSPAGTHDLFAYGGGNFAFTNDVPPNQPSTNLSLWFFNGDTALVVSNSSTLDGATYTNTFDAPLQANMTVLFWARGFPSSAWYYWVSKNGDSGTPNNGWNVRDYGYNYNYACYTIRETGSPGRADLGQTLNAGYDDLGSSIPSNDGQWHQYAATFNSVTGNRNLYVDGILTAQETNNISFNPATLEHLVIGGIDKSPGNTFGEYFNGELYNVQIYNYELAPATILATVGPLPPSIEGLPATNTVFANTTAQFRPMGIWAPRAVAFVR